nr:substrate-binding domain-containing protein [uncultured Blautia sp.]
MKKMASASIAILSVSALFLALGNHSVQSITDPVKVNAQDEASEQDSEGQDSPLSQIDTSMDLKPGTKIAVVSKSKKGQFWDLVQKGMEQAVSDVNDAYNFEKDDKITMTFEGSSDETDVESQVNTLDAVIAENPDVVCVSAGDSESCQAQLESARENGIPVVTFDSDVSSEDLVAAYCGTDNQKLGDIAAKRMAHYLKNHGTVAVFSPQEKTLSCKARVEAFQESIADYPGIEVVQVIYSDQVDDMEAAIRGVLEIYPKLDGIFCTNGDISDLCLSLVQDAGRDSITFIGTDATSAQQDAIRNVTEVGTISQQPYAIGYQTILAALQATTEGITSSEKTTLLDPAWIDADALEDSYYADYIYE